jgi:hypothetical protein
MTPGWLGCGDLETPSDLNDTIATTEQAGVLQGTWNEVTRFRGYPARSRTEVASYLGSSAAYIFVRGNEREFRGQCSSLLVGASTLWSADHCGRNGPKQRNIFWPTAQIGAVFGRFTIDFPRSSPDTAGGDFDTFADFEQGHGSNIHLVQRFRELGLSPVDFGRGRQRGGDLAVPVAGILQSLLTSASAERHALFEADFFDQTVNGLAILENLENGDFAGVRNFQCAHSGTDNRDRARDLVSIACEPVYLKARHGRHIAVYPGELWGWTEAAAEPSRRNDEIVSISINVRPERRDWRRSGAFGAACGTSCAQPSILLSPSGTRGRAYTNSASPCDLSVNGPWRACALHDFDGLKGSSGGAVIGLQDLTVLGVQSGGEECFSPSECEDIEARGIFAEVSRPFASHARANVSPIPKPDTDPPVSSRGEEYWANTSISNLVGETSPEHTQIQLRCGYRGNYVNGITGHLGTLKDFITYGVGGIAIHCRPDTTSTRDLLRLETHSMHGAGSSDFMWNMQQREPDSAEETEYPNFRYQAYRNLIYGNGPPVPYEDIYRRGQERLCGPGFALHGLGSSARDENILHDLVDLECRRISRIWSIEPQGFDLAPQDPGLAPNNSASCGGGWMVGMVVHRHPETHAVSGLEPICGGFDTQGMTL